MKISIFSTLFAIAAFFAVGFGLAFPVEKSPPVQTAAAVQNGQSKAMNLIEPMQKVCADCGDVFQTHLYVNAVCNNCAAKMLGRTSISDNTGITIIKPKIFNTTKDINYSPPPEKFSGFASDCSPRGKI